jgi:putative oxidoreductase
LRGGRPREGDPPRHDLWYFPARARRWNKRAPLNRGGFNMATQRLYVPALGPIYGKLHSYAPAILRVGLGAILVPHGAQKLFGMFGGGGISGTAALFDRLGYAPGILWGTLVGCVEFFGGILLVLGLFTRPVALALTIFMIFGVHFTSKTGGFFWLNRGSEFSILILLCAIYFLIRGGGEYSLDRKLRREF